ncbi:enoyl-CoA hydratase-related protein [Streptomyces sp. NBC_00090]|uniref:enoyl-CoA hydratase-related protein n=1 Tax=Streptomyces sp. NBC_00090 TaxID=2903619 RepID=UPI003252A53F
MTVRVRDPGGRVTLAIHACRKPVIAAINGVAVGIGATMTLAMDARLMSTNARFGLAFGRLGITPEVVSTWYLPRLVGMPKLLKRAREGHAWGCAAKKGIVLALGWWERL